MRVFLPLAITMFATAALAEDGFDCKKPDTLPQMRLSFCAYKDFEKADAALNVAWLKLRAMVRSSETKTPEFKGWFDKALTAQRSWLAYRDAQCEVEGFTFNGGSMQPMIVSICKTRLTEARTREVTQMQAEN